MAPLFFSILDRVLLNFIKKFEFGNNGLFTGYGGVLLYLYLSYRKCPTSRLSDDIKYFIDKALYVCKNYESSFLVSCGHGGLYWILSKIAELNIANLSGLPDICDELGKYVRISARQNIDSKNHDLMFGFMGQIIALTDISGEDTATINLRAESIKYFKDRIKLGLISKELWEESGNLNLGVAHGLPGFIAYLDQYGEDIWDNIIDGLDNLIKYRRVQNEGQSGVFPHEVPINDSSFISRLAWCYGDLGILASFAKSSGLTRVDRFSPIIKELIKSVTSRKFSDSAIDFNDFYGKDISICHGLAGVYLQFLLLEKSPYIHIKDKEVIKLIRENYWGPQLSESHQNFCQKIYSNLRADSTHESIKNMDLLTGALGYEVIKLSEELKEFTWCKFLLLQ